MEHYAYLIRLNQKEDKPDEKRMETNCLFVPGGSVLKTGATYRVSGFAIQQRIKTCSSQYLFPFHCKIHKISSLTDTQANCICCTFIGGRYHRFLTVAIQVLRQVPHSSKLEWKTFSRFDQVRILISKLKRTSLQVYS